MFPSMNSRPNFTSQNVTKHPTKLSTLVPIFPILFCYPHFSIRIFLSAFFHPHFSIRIFPSAFFHPHFSIRIFPSAFFHPHFSIRIFHPHFSIRHPPSAIRRHPVRTLQRPLHMSRIEFNELSSCEVRRLNQVETVDILRIGSAVLQAWFTRE